MVIGLVATLIIPSVGTIFGSSNNHNVYAIGGIVSDSSSCVAIGGTWTSPNYCSTGNLNVANGETLTISSGIILATGNLVVNSGTIENSGTLQTISVNNYGAFNNHGHYTTSGYAQFNNYANAVISNDGTFDVAGAGRLDNYGTINNLPTGTFTADTHARSVYNWAVFTNAGTLNKDETDFYNQAGGTLTNNGIMNSYGQFNTFWNFGGNFINNGNFTTTDGHASFTSGTFTNSGTLIGTTIHGDTSSGITINGGTFTNNANGLIINDVTLNNNLGAALTNNGIIRNECNSIYNGNEPAPNPTVHITCPTATISSSGSTVGSPVSLTANIVGGVPPFKYSWNFILPPAGSTATFSNPTSATSSFTPDLPGNYWLGVTITDSEFIPQTIGAQITIPVTATPIDKTSPVVTVSSPITASATSPSGASVTFTASATDPDDAAGPVQCNPASGSTFPIGTTTVTCTSTDTHGNTGTASFTVTVNKITTTTALSSSANPSTFDNSVTFTASITPNTATGTVTFSIDGTPQTPVTVSSGTATLSTSSLSVGSHSITASYSGDTNDLSSTSTTLTQTVKPISFSSFTAKVHIEDKYTHFELKSKFTLGTGSSGFNPATDNISLQVGTFSTTIPAGSFKHDDKNYEFKGAINGVHIEASIKSLGSNTFELKVEAEHANLTGTVNPVPVQITMGNNSGTDTVNAKIDVDHDNDTDHNSSRDNNSLHHDSK